jgi:hypothetical protein
MQICFYFNGQKHQILHGLATACALSRRPDAEVTVASPNRSAVAYARTAAQRLGDGGIRFKDLDSPLLSLARRLTGKDVPLKRLTLLAWSRWLQRFDAVAVTERTSTALRHLGRRCPKLVHLDHGAGDRAAGFDARIRHFDLALLAGEKQRTLLLQRGIITAERSAVVGYTKFEAADALRHPPRSLFAEGRRPVVLYNPHFSTLGSWDAMGPDILRQFAGQDAYNLIVAPHARALDGRRNAQTWRAISETYARHPGIHVDLATDDCFDMTHTDQADVYLGDVSSQVYEFLRKPRPCLFLNPHRVDWQADPHYAHWQLGPVLQEADRILPAIDHAVREHGHYRERQDQAFRDTFSTTGVAPSQRAAAAIMAHCSPGIAGR